MALFFHIHPDNPQMHLIVKAANVIKEGGVVVYPTDSAYGLGCQLGNKKAMERIRQIRQLGQDHYMAIMCRDLSDLATYARVDNPTFRLLKAFTPGPYTFLLKATSEVPKRLLHPKRKVIGLRIPNHKVTQTLLEALDEPLMTTTLILPGAHLPLIEPEAMRDILGKHVDLIIDGGYCGVEQTTVVDLTMTKPKVIRYGKGDIASFLEG
jgi:tRNA threonylcarbamoyl adenosine modification protein (Sua5/YciO/YrdC/YwlC family)